MSTFLEEQDKIFNKIRGLIKNGFLGIKEKTNDIIEETVLSNPVIETVKEIKNGEEKPVVKKSKSKNKNKK